MALQAIFAWPGGKWRLARRIIKHFPPHQAYCEVFGGSAAVLFQKDPVPLEVYNDIDSNLVNFFRVLRDEERLKELVRLLELTPYSREEYAEFKRKLKMGEWRDDVERAFMWWYVAQNSFSKFEGGWKYNIGIDPSQSRYFPRIYYNKIRNFGSFHRRIKNVQIEHLAWDECIEKYINTWKKQGLFYLDPPYYPDTRVEKIYTHEFTVKDHEELVKFLNAYRHLSYFVLSGYENPLYEKELKDWRKVCFEATVTMSKFKGHKRQDCIWMNYDEFGNIIFR